MQPEHKNFVLRQRDRKLEIGPTFRFTSSLQVERVMDRLNHDTGLYFDHKDINKNQDGF